MLAVLALLLLDSPARAQATAPTLTYTLKSGNSDVGSPDLGVWVQGNPLPSLGFLAVDLPLQQPFVIATFGSWADVSGARWVSPSTNGLAPQEGYEYFTLFALPPAYKSARLDLFWRADDIGELAINGLRLGAPRPSFAPTGPVGEFHGDITPFVTAGMNRLQFFVGNARLGVNRTGLTFTATITLSRAFASRAVSVTLAGLAAGTFDPQKLSVWHFQRENPILRPEGELEMQAGEGNIYATDVYRKGDTWSMLYGGQGRDGHDRIFGADSLDGIHWIRAQGGKPIIDGDRDAGGAIKDGSPAADWNRNRIAVAFLQKEVRVWTADGRIVPIGVLAIDAGRAEVEIPESLIGQAVVFDVLAEDGTTVLARSDPVVLKANLPFQFDGSRIILLP